MYFLSVATHNVARVKRASVPQACRAFRGGVGRGSNDDAAKTGGVGMWRMRVDANSDGSRHPAEWPEAEGIRCIFRRRRRRYVSLACGFLVNRVWHSCHSGTTIVSLTSLNDFTWRSYFRTRRQYSTKSLRYNSNTIVSAINRHGFKIATIITGDKCLTIFSTII